MTKAELAEKVSADSGLTKKDASEVVETIFEIMKDALCTGDILKISGFGSFSVREKNDRNGRNPQTGETITITRRRVVAYKTSTLLKQAINKN